MRTSGSTGPVKARLAGWTRSSSHSVWGEPGNEGPTGNPFRFTGRRLDAETGLYYYRTRYYSPTLGRFLQTDPVGYGDNMNMYAYVGNQPDVYDAILALCCSCTDCSRPLSAGSNHTSWYFGWTVRLNCRKTG